MKLAKKENRPAAPMVEAIRTAKQQNKVSEMKQDQLIQFVRGELKKILVRLGRVNVNSDVLLVAAEDLIFDLQSKYQNLTTAEVTLALRYGALNSDNINFSSRQVAEWMRTYFTELRPQAYEAPKQSHVPAQIENFNPCELIQKAFKRWKAGQPTYAAERVLHHLDQMDKFKPDSDKVLETLGIVIGRIKGQIATNGMAGVAKIIINDRKTDLKNVDRALTDAEIIPTELPEWLSIELEKGLLEDYFETCDKLNIPVC